MMSKKMSGVARMCGLPYNDYYRLVGTPDVPAPTHRVPPYKALHYTDSEAQQIVKKMKQLKAVAE